MTTATPIYGAVSTLPFSLSTLAHSSTLDLGRQSAVADNTASFDDAIDAFIGGIVTTSTTASTARQIEVWSFGSWDNGSTFTVGASTVDAGLNVSSMKTLMKLITIIPTMQGASTYRWGPFSMAQAYGGLLPTKWGIFITHNTGVALGAAVGNHNLSYIPVKFESN